MHILFVCDYICIQYKRIAEEATRQCNDVKAALHREHAETLRADREEQQAAVDAVARRHQLLVSGCGRMLCELPIVASVVSKWVC